MKKVININFQGQVIAIEETAYEILNRYIDSLQSYFSKEEGGDEIVNDIECRIAELFGNRLRHGISCITDEDVEAIIASIGRPQEFDSDYAEQTGSESTPHDEQQASSGAEPYPEGSGRQSLYRNANDQIIGGVCSGLAHYFKTDPVWIRILFVLFFGVLFWVYIVLWIVLKPKPLETNVTKRLYRNPNDRFIGGVCGGIAAYFRIDSWIPRVLFLLPLLLNMIGMISIFPLDRLFDDVDFNWNFNMSMVLVYIVLWAIIPEAKTVKQKLEMMGEEEYIRSIREKVNDNVSSTRNRAKNEKTSGTADQENVSGFEATDDSRRRVSAEEMPPEPPVTGRRTGAVASSERSGCLNALIILIKIVFFSFVGLFLLVITGLFVTLLVTGTHLSPLKSLFIDPGYETTLLYVTLGLILLVPVIALIVWIVRRAMKARTRPVIGIVAALLWIAGLVLGSVLSVRIADKFSVESSGEQIVSVTPVTSSRMYVDMLPYTEDYTKFRAGYGPDAEAIDDLPYLTINEDSLLMDNVNLQIGKSSDSLLHVKVIFATRGKDLRTAKRDLDGFSYEIIQRDSLILIPEFLAVPVEQGFRNQSVTVEISVPAGKSVEVSEALDEYKNNRPPSVVRKRIMKHTRHSVYQPVDISV
jgi:phage shock protein PspC (stress-responsive transcriptional regulator)